MQESKEKDRYRKGSVAIIVSNGWLQLRFNWGGKRHYLSLGLQESKANRKVAEAKAKLIASDIIYERFDPTLQKYNPRLPSVSITR